MTINESIDIARRFSNPDAKKPVLSEAEAAAVPAVEPHPTMMGLRVAQQHGQHNAIMQQEPKEEEQKPDPARVMYWALQ